MSIFRSVSRCLIQLVRPTISPFFCTDAVSPPSLTNLNSDMASSRQKRIVWIDMEMTGLNIEYNKILEIACLITDENLKIISDEFHIVLNQTEEELQKMNEWCKKTHGESGLIEKVRASKVSEKKADEELLFFMMKYIPKGKCPMAGNSVYMDRLFLRKYMSSSNDYMHYRIIDVSSIKEVVKRWRPDIYNNVPKKQLTHTALLDIKESIRELDYYRTHVFMNSNHNNENL